MLNRLKRLESKIRPEGRLIWAVESSEQAGMYKVLDDGQEYVHTKAEVEALAGPHDNLTMITIVHDDEPEEVNNADDGREA